MREEERNARAKAHLHLLNALAAANAAMRELAAAEASGAGVDAPATQPSLDALEAQLAALLAVLRGGHGGGGGGAGRAAAASGVAACPMDCGAAAESTEASAMGSAVFSTTAARGGAGACARVGGGAGGGGGGCSDEDAPGILAPGLTVSQFLRDIVGGRALVGSRDEWVAYWRGRVMHLALLAHQRRSGAAGRDALERALCEMGVRFGALFLYGSYALEVIVLDMETGQRRDAPQTLWDRVAASLALSPDQALMFALLNRWWKTATAAFTAERTELARRALERPADLALQQAAADGLARVNAQYLAAAVAVLAVTLFGVTRPEQVAASWISCWPHMPIMTAIFEALERVRSV